MDLLDVLAPVPISCHALIRLDTTRSTEFIDLTDRLQQLVARTRIHCGILNLQTLHTTTAVVVNELEPLLLEDFEALLEAAAPRNAGYRHDDLRCRTVNLTPDERINGHAHCRAVHARLRGVAQRRRRPDTAGTLAARADGRARRPAHARAVGRRRGREAVMKVKMILPALTEATSPFWRPIKYSLFPPLGLATLAAYLRIRTMRSRFRTSTSRRSI